MIKYLFLLYAVAVHSDVTPTTGVAPWLPLSNGRHIPNLGLGTWLGFSKEGGLEPVKNNDVEKAVEFAFDAGYRLIDTAHIYFTEDQVGRAINKKISEGVVTRDEIFVTTKLWNDHHAKDQVVPAIRESLKKLNLDYLDLYLIHWPFGANADQTLNNIDYLDTWQGMIEALNLGLTKSIGVANFNQQQLERLISSSTVKPAVLQIEVNLNIQQSSLLAYCRKENITVMGYTPCGSLFPSKAASDAPPPRVDEPALVDVANKHNKTVPQIVLKYLVDLGVIPIPKSVSTTRIAQNLGVFDATLTQQERDLLKSYDKNYRTIGVKFWSQSPYYPFEKN